MPAPALLRAGEGSFAITHDLHVTLAGDDSPRLRAAVSRMLQRLENQTGLELQKQLGKTATPSPNAIHITVASDGAAVQGVEEDESYKLTATPTSIRIDAPTTVGAMHALETLLQLVEARQNSYVVPAVTVEDAPRFRWRGLMIDCARHFEPLDVLKRNIDAMAAVKLNVFHWHLVDDQGFRIESKRFPRLTSAGSDGLFYTQNDARELVRYARERGVRVVPEFEMPGHSTAWLVAYPNLASGSVPPGIRREFGVSDYVLDPTRDETYKFIGDFLEEMVAVFPDAFIHIGGDEAPAPDWKTNPKILGFMRQHNLKDNDALQAYFNQRVLKILKGLNRRMIGWDEIFNPALPKDVAIQSWRGEESLAAAAIAGYQGVLSAPYYLDAMKPAGVHYLADPIPVNTKLTPAQQKMVLGGEICMWAEQLDRHTIDSRIWPRSAAIAERFWSRQDLRDVDDMYRRLGKVSVELEALGLRQISSEDAGLRDLAGSENIDALRSFALAFEPVSFSDRYEEQHTSALTALTQFVDAVRPDPPIRHELEVAAKKFLQNPAGETSSSKVLTDFFRQVNGSIPEVRSRMEASPRLAAMRERTAQLEALSGAGQEAVRLLSSGTAAPAGWKQDTLARIEAAKKPSAIVRFTFLQPLTDLVNATE